MQNNQNPSQNPNQQQQQQSNPGLPQSFDDILKELQVTNQRLNQGLPLEEALQAYERGVKLFQQAQYLLNEAEERIKILKDAP